MTRSARRTRAVGALLACLMLLVACGGTDRAEETAPSAPLTAPTGNSTQRAGSTPSSKVTRTPRRGTPTIQPTTRPTARPTTQAPPDRPRRPRAPFGGRRVLAVSVDGLNPQALLRLGRTGAPSIFRLFAEGAGTIDARSEVEITDTLPNHVGMVTGRPIDPAAGGHGVTWNTKIPGRTVQSAAGEPVDSVFTAIHDAGGSTAVFAGKAKFALFEDSWPDAVDTTVIEENADRLVERAVTDLREERRTFTFVHLAQPDRSGHAFGWLSSRYLDAVRLADRAVGRLLATIDADPVLARSEVVVLTSDHGGQPGTRGHGDADAPADYTIPFVVRGRGVPHGDLYDLVPALVDPGTSRPAYAGPQPVRNCDVANVTTALLGLTAVPGSRCEREQKIGVALGFSRSSR